MNRILNFPEDTGKIDSIFTLLKAPLFDNIKMGLSS
jgi:hypothetical protein